jgi:hypothetical protein
MNGMANLVNGVWKVRAGVHVTPTLSYDDNVLRGDAKIKLHPDERQRFNTVRGQFIDPARNWKNVAFPEVTAAEFVSRDNNQKLYRDVSLDMTKDVYMAQRLAFGILEQSDLEVTAILPTNFKTLPVEVGGTIQYSNEKMGWTDKEFRVLRYKLSDMGGIDLVVREDAAAAYTVVGTAEYSVANDTGYTTNDPGVPPPSNLTATALLGAIKLTWDDPASRLYEQIEIHAAEDNTRGNAVLIGTTTQSPYIDYLPTTYRKLYYWIRAVSFKGDVSDWEPDSTTTTANTAPLTDSGNHLVIDPDFDLSSAFDVYWSSSVKDGSGGSGASVTFNSGGGANSSNAVDIDPGSGTDGTANNSITAIKRFRINFGWLDVRLRYKITIGSATIDAFYVLAEGFTAESGGTEVISSEVAAPTLVADSAWHTVRIPVPITDADTAQFWELTIGSRDTSVTAGVIRIDSVFVTQVIAPNERFTKVENGDYTFVIGDAGTIVSKTSGGAGETYTIPANSSVAFPIGTVIEVENSGGGTLSIAITTDTLVNTADGATGTRTLADDGIATLRKIAATTWKITGEPLT